jgi:hypothetical protein
MRNISDNSCRVNQNTHLCPIKLLRKSYRLGNNVEKYGIARQVTDDNTTECMPYACWIPKLQTYSEYTRFIAFPRQQWLPNAPQSSVICTLSCYTKRDDSLCGPKHVADWLVTIYCYIINIIVLYGSVLMMNHFKTQRDVLH